MIAYRQDRSPWFGIYSPYGSVIPKAIFIAFPAGIIAAVLKYCDNKGYLGDWTGMDMVKNSVALSSFAFLLGFLIVFRTSQAYNRFWGGVQDVHQMCADWFDSAGMVCAFCGTVKGETDEAIRFKHTVVRLFSILSSCALQSLTDDENLTLEGFDTLDPESLDISAAEVLEDTEHKVELVFQWIQLLIVKNMELNVITVPAPILTRVFQELAAGMLRYHDASKVSRVPFPFPYAQVAHVLLLIHWSLVPICMVQWTNWVSVAFFATFLQVMVFWALNLVAVEIEQPFGKDANDIELVELQDRFNQHLLLLMSEKAQSEPQLRDDVQTEELRDRLEGATNGHVHSIVMAHRTQTLSSNKLRSALSSTSLSGFSRSGASSKSMRKYSDAPDKQADNAAMSGTGGTLKLGELGALATASTEAVPQARNCPPTLPNDEPSRLFVARAGVTNEHRIDLVDASTRDGETQTGRMRFREADGTDPPGACRDQGEVAQQAQQLELRSPESEGVIFSQGVASDCRQLRADAGGRQKGVRFGDRPPEAVIVSDMHAP